MAGNYLKWRQDMEGKKVACILNFFFFFFSRSTLFLSFQLQLQFYMQKRQGGSPSICHPWEPVNTWHCMYVCVAQLCLTLCDLRDCSPPGFSVHGIILARILEWVAISFSSGIFPPQGLKLHLLNFLY